MTATTPDTEHRPSAAERHHELAMAAIQRTPQAPEHTVGLTLNAKGDVQIEVTGRGTDLDGLVASVSAHFDALRAAYPRGNGGEK